VVAVAVESVVLSPQYGSNCYVVSASPASGEAAIVDPGGEPGPLLRLLAGRGLAAAAILVTHADVDHIAGVAELARVRGTDVWMPAGEADDLRRGTTRHGIPVAPHDPEHVVTDGDRIAAAGIEFEVIGIPGHSPGHVAYATDGAIFSGDLLFHDSVGRVDFPGGDWQALLDSISRLLARFGPEARLYPGHDAPTTLGRELEHNPFLGELRAVG
jgi:hydroxyacylglutathione hydrolase